MRGPSSSKNVYCCLPTPLGYTTGRLQAKQTQKRHRVSDRDGDHAWIVLLRILAKDCDSPGNGTKVFDGLYDQLALSTFPSWSASTEIPRRLTSPTRCAETGLLSPSSPEMPYSMQPQTSKDVSRWNCPASSIDSRSPSDRPFDAAMFRHPLLHIANRFQQ